MHTLANELYLLSMFDKKSSIGFSSSRTLSFALAAAILANLILIGKISLQDGKKVVITDETPVDDTLLNTYLERIKDSGSIKRLAFWIEEFGSRRKRIQKECFASLLENGIIQEIEKRYIWNTPQKALEKNASIKYLSKQKIREIILLDKEADINSVALISLIKVSKLSDHIFTKDEIKIARSKIDDLLKTEQIGNSLLEAIEAITSTVAIIIASS